jgi:Family of unknown function (DUF6527)
MTRIETLQTEFVDFIPAKLEAGIIYVSRKYLTASHLCCCGCGNKVVTPLKPGGWKLTTTGNSITLCPSIGNWNFPCRSHYWVRRNQVEWAAKFTQARIDAVRRNDALARQQYFDRLQEPKSLWHRIIRRLFG